MSLANKIKEIRAHHGLSQDAFCEVLGEKPSKVRDIESGRQRVNDEFLRKLLAHFPVDMNWLFDVAGWGGAPGHPRIEQPDDGKPLAGHVVVDGEDFSLLERKDLSVSAGHGLAPVAGGITESLIVSRTWLLRNGLTADLSFLVKVRGDSMEPTIPDGSLVLVNTAERWSIAPGVYAFTRGGEAFIKRVAPVNIGKDGRPSKITIASDNPAYSAEVLSGSQLNTFKPVGRVRAVFSEVS